MPEPLVYVQAMTAAAISAIIVLIAASLRPAAIRAESASRQTATRIAAFTFGLVLGYYVLGVRWNRPPVNCLDRFLMVVVPATLGVELIAAYRASMCRWVWLLRLALAATIPFILLHGSVYFTGFEKNSTPWQAVTLVAVTGATLVAVWGLLFWLSLRSPGVSIPFSLSLSILCAGATVMMAGYIKGGAAAFPLAATLLATSVVANLISKRSGATAEFDASAILGIGVVGLFSLLFIGRFFGGLSNGRALTMLLAPLLCWASELPLLRHRHPWLVASLRIVLVAVLLAIVLARAKQDFDRDMGPLLKAAPTKEITHQHATRRAGDSLRNLHG